MGNSAKITSCVRKTSKVSTSGSQISEKCCNCNLTDKCEDFNNFFALLVKNQPTTFHCNLTNFLKLKKKHTTLSFFLEPPTVNEILKLICSLNVNKAVGHDNIPAFFLKTAPFVIASYLCVFVRFFSKMEFFLMLVK